MFNPDHTRKLKQKLIDLFTGLPRTQAFLNKIIGFPWTSAEQKTRAWRIARKMAEAESNKIKDNLKQTT